MVIETTSNTTTPTATATAGAAAALSLPSGVWALLAAAVAVTGASL